MDVDIGRVIAGKYELVRLIGKGAMGEVWLAKHNSLGGEFAIKLVEPTDDVEAETAAGRFQLEAQIAAKLSRKTRHIVSVSDHGEEGGLAYLVMELLEGESLEARVQRVGQLPLAEVAAIVMQVTRGLAVAHEEGIFHRDLKPANVWLAKDEDGRLVVKLLDFGIARARKSFSTRSPFVTSKDMVLGTPSYMSPEQARGLATLDHRCDLWALSVVAYEALTRKIPFEGETVEDIFLSICTFRVVPIHARRNDLPPGLDGFFVRAFAPKVDDRYATASELAEAFEQLVSPEDLERALGVPLTPASARRLEAARRSQPDFGQAPVGGQFAPPVPMPMPFGPPTPGLPFGPPTPGQAFRPAAPSAAFGPPTPGAAFGVPGPPPGWHPGSSPNIAPSDPFGGRQRSSPDLDPVALGDAGLPRRGASTWMIAMAAAFATVVVGVLLFVTFRNTNLTHGGRTDSPAVTPTTIPTTSTTAVAAASPTTATATATASSPAGSAPPPSPPTPTIAARPTPPATGTGKKPGADTAKPPAPPPPVPPPPAPVASKAPAPAHSVKKAEVF